jgi:hypothetical protein
MTHQQKLEHDRKIWKKKVEDFEASGLSATEFAKKNEISPYQFHYWKNKFATTSKKVQVRSSESRKPMPLIKVTTNTAIPSRQLPDPQWLADLIKALL